MTTHSKTCKFLKQSIRRFVMPLKELTKEKFLYSKFQYDIHSAQDEKLRNDLLELQKKAKKQQNNKRKSLTDFSLKKSTHTHMQTKALTSFEIPIFRPFKAFQFALC